MGKSLNGKELGKGISQRKDGTYMGRFTDRFGKKECIYDKNLNNLRKKLRDAQYEDERCLNLSTSGMTLNEWFDIWIKDFKTDCRKSTIINYHTHYNRVKETLGWRRLASISTIMIQQAINQIKGVPSKLRTRGVLCDMFKTAVENDLVHRNPVSRVKISKSLMNNEHPRVLTSEEQKIFCKETTPYWYHELYVFALETGMRIGEIAALQWNDIDLDDRMIFVRHTLSYFKEDGKYLYEFNNTKTINGMRRIPLTRAAYKALTNQKEKKLIIEKQGKYAGDGFEDLVFTTRNNTPVNANVVGDNIDKMVSRIRKYYPDYPSVTPHMFRHTFATRAIENGVRPKTLQKILGHKSIEITMNLYCHVTDEALYEEMMKMEPGA